MPPMLYNPDSPFFPGGLPGSVGPVPTPAMPAGMFPTNVRWGDVVTLSGPFAGISQGQLRVKFAGVPWESPALLGPYSASVIVPQGAQTGACMIEVNGRQVFGTQCVVTPATGYYGQKVMPREFPQIRAWKNQGEGSPLLGTPEPSVWKTALLFAGLIVVAYLSGRS